MWLNYLSKSDESLESWEYLYFLSLDTLSTSFSSLFITISAFSEGMCSMVAMMVMDYVDDLTIL